MKIIIRAPYLHHPVGYQYTTNIKYLCTILKTIIAPKILGYQLVILHPKSLLVNRAKKLDIPNLPKVPKNKKETKEGDKETKEGE